MIYCTTLNYCKNNIRKLNFFAELSPSQLRCLQSLQVCTFIGAKLLQKQEYYQPTGNLAINKLTRNRVNVLIFTHKTILSSFKINLMIIMIPRMLSFLWFAILQYFSNDWDFFKKYIPLWFARRRKTHLLATLSTQHNEICKLYITHFVQCHF